MLDSPLHDDESSVFIDQFVICIDLAVLLHILQNIPMNRRLVQPTRLMNRIKPQSHMNRPTRLLIKKHALSKLHNPIIRTNSRLAQTIRPLNLQNLLQQLITLSRRSLVLDV